MWPSPFTGFHALMRRTASMVLLLISNIHDYPRQPLRPKADNPVAGLPFENPGVRNSMVDMVGASGTLDLVDPPADVQGWRKSPFCLGNDRVRGRLCDPLALSVVGVGDPEGAVPGVIERYFANSVRKGPDL